MGPPPGCASPVRSGGFRLDPAGALGLLRRYQLPDPADASRARAAARLLPVPLVVDGKAELPRRSGRLFAEGGVRGRIEAAPAPRGSSVALCKLGVAAATVPFSWSGPAFRAEVNDDGFRLASSQASVLRDERYLEALRVVERQARELLHLPPYEE